MNSIIHDFDQAPTNKTGLIVGFELLSEHTDLRILGDKAYIGVKKEAQLWTENHIRLQTILRRNQYKQLPTFLHHLFSSVRQIIETVNTRISNQFIIEANHAHTFWGLCTRL